MHLLILNVSQRLASVFPPVFLSNDSFIFILPFLLFTATSTCVTVALQYFMTAVTVSG